MPLKRGSSRTVISENIRELHHGDTYAHTERKVGKRKADKQAGAVAPGVRSTQPQTPRARSISA